MIGLEVLKDIREFIEQARTTHIITDGLKVIEKELKEKEKQENALKTISDIIRDFNKGELANSKCALEEITNILKEVLL